MMYNNSLPSVLLQGLVSVATAAFLITSSLASQFYVSPAGSAASSGSLSSPWDLQTALNQPAAVKPGDTIWLRAGVYTHLPQAVTVGNEGYIFFSKLTGTAANPIIVQGYPGEHATIDGGAYGGGVYGYHANTRATIEIQGAYTWFKDLEIASLSKEARFSPDDSSFPTSITRSDGPYVHGVGIKFINLVIHDLTAGISAWSSAQNFEAYGNVVYNNGWLGTPHTHGHNVYTQNYISSAPKYFTDNIFLNCFQNNTQAYGSSSSQVAHYRFNFNTYINRPILIGGRTDTQLQDNQFNNNYLFNSDLSLIYQPGTNYLDVMAASNYLVDGALQAGSWKNATITNNTIISTTGSFVADIVIQTAGTVLRPWTWNRNTYYAYDVNNTYPVNLKYFNVETEGYRDFAAWKTRTGYDANSVFKNALPTANYVILRPNQYDNDRANLTIYNWQNLNTVIVDTSVLGASGWAAGDTFELRSAQDYFKDVVTGTYNGSSITVNMSAAAHSIALPLGWNATLGANTFPRFGAFVLIKKSGAGSPVVNNPPIVNISSPASGASFGTLTSIDFTVAASDGGGTVSKVELFNGTTLLGTAVASPYNFAWNNAPAGSYTLTARATDNLGAMTTSAPINIAVGTTSGSQGAFITSALMGALRNDFTGWLGMKITVSGSPLVLTSLGRIRFSGNGASHKVKLVNASTGSDVPNASVSISLAGGNVGQFNYAPLASPVTLAANTSYYLVSQETAGGDQWASGTTVVTTTTVAACNGPILSNSSSWTLRTPANTTFGPVDFTYTTLTLNQAPAVSITSPISGATFAAPANLNINAAANDTDGMVIKVECYNGTTLLGTASTSPYNIPLNNLGAGNYTLTAKATDNGGAVSTSAPINFTVGTVSSSQISFVTSVTLGTLRNDFNGWLGMKFTLGASPMTVKALGRVFFTGNTGNHTLKLVNASTGADVLNGSVSVSMAGGTAGQFKYMPLATAVTLAANSSYYLVSQEKPGGDIWATSNTALTTTTVATCNGAILSNSGSWTFRTPANKTFVPVDLKY